MSALFVSHASKDDARVNALEAWLRDNGFDDFFIDHKNIDAGDKWEEALQAAGGSCRVVICLVSEHWLASHECWSEFRTARQGGKRIIPLFLVANAEGEMADRLAKVRARDQGIDLSPCISDDGALDLCRNSAVTDELRLGLRAAGALTHVGLDPYAFAIDRQAHKYPFRGLSAFGDDDADAALFFGRTTEIAEVLEEIRRMGDGAARRPLMILGASGAGKSSLIRAGVIPRLRREKPAWLPLRAFRPGRDPLLSLSEAVVRTLKDYGRHDVLGNVRDRLQAAWKDAARNEDGTLSQAGLATLAAALARESKALREAAALPSASVLVSVDQAEEIARAGNESGEALADYLRAALVPSIDWHLVFTIRSDNFDELQGHRRFQDLKGNPYDLRALPIFHFKNVVEDPARRYDVLVQPDLVDELIHDAEDSTASGSTAKERNALPLLAFALERLWRQYAENGRLTKGDYENVGRLNRLIQDAADRALLGLEPEHDVAAPTGAAPARLLKLGAETFVPKLARTNERGATVRHVAKWTDFSEESHSLLDRFSRWRLVERRGSDPGEGGGTVEVTHETLFREWPKLKDWIASDRDELYTLGSVQNAAEAWDLRGRNAGWLSHRSDRLADARALTRNPLYDEALNDVDRAYIRACIAIERRRRLVTVVLPISLVIIVVGLLSIGFEQFTTSDILTREASRNNGRYEDSGGRSPQFGPMAARYALGAISLQQSVPAARFLSPCPNDPDKFEAECELRRSGLIEPVIARFAMRGSSRPRIAAFGADARTVMVASDDGSIREWTLPKSEMVVARLAKGDISSGSVDPLNSRLLTLHHDHWVRIYNLRDGSEILAVKPDRQSSIQLARLSADGSRMVTATYDKVAHVWDLQTGIATKTQTLSGHVARVTDAAFNADGTRIVTASEDGTARVWDAATGAIIVMLSGHEAPVQTAAFSADGSRIVTASDDETAQIWDAKTGARLQRLIGHRGPVLAALFSPNGRLVATAAGPRYEQPQIEGISTVDAVVAEALVRPSDGANGNGGGNGGDGGGGGGDGATDSDTVYLWDASSGEMLAILKRGEISARTLSFSPDSRRLLALGDHVQVWEPAELGSLAGIELHAWMCRAERSRYDPTLYEFPLEQHGADRRLMGRARNVCDWASLGSTEGWHQVWNRWRYILLRRDAYADIERRQPPQ